MSGLVERWQWTIVHLFLILDLTPSSQRTFDASYPGSILSQKATEDIWCFAPSKEPVLEYLKALPIQP
jgi:hypothetical protein